MEKYDLIIIGSGPSGRSAAIQAGKLGKKVLVVEKQNVLGGVSIHTGTIPSKTLINTILNLSGYKDRSFYGQSYRVKEDIDASDLKYRLKRTLNNEVDVLEHQFNRNYVSSIYGIANFIDKNTLRIKTSADEEVTVQSEKFIIATGTKTFRPDWVPFNKKNVFDSNEILKIDRIPRSIVVIGAGVIGVEYATAFAALDIKVHLIEPRSSYLDFIDKKTVDYFTHIIRENGIDVRLNSNTTSIVDNGTSVTTHLDDGRKITTDMVLFAAGRVGNVASLNLSAVNIDTDHRMRISVDRETYQTNVDNIYATGDVIGAPSLASTSSQQGRIAACHALSHVTVKPSPWFPYGIYSIPEISTCGMSEEELQERGISFETGLARYRETSRGNIMGISNGQLKLLFSLKTRRLLGCQIVGDGATELITTAQAVMDLKGTVDYFVRTITNYPTYSELFKIAGLDAFNKMS